MPNRELTKSTLFSIVIPVYNEQETLPALFQRITEVAEQLPVSVEVILVNDGSRDDSLRIMRSFVEKDPRIRVVDLSRNFGAQEAISAGLHVAKGDVVGIIDADLQDPPEVFLGMLRRWQEGVDVIYGQRRTREGESWFKLWTAKTFYRVLSFVANVDIPQNTGEFRTADRKVVDVLNSMPERQKFLRGMFAWLGFRQEGFLYDRKARMAGETKYPLRKMLALSVDGILSFSISPLRWMIGLGLIITLLGFLGGMYLLIVKLFLPAAFPPGLFGLFAAVLFMFGINFICLGTIGEYVGRVFVNSQNRPYFLINEIYQQDPSWKGREE